MGFPWVGGRGEQVVKLVNDSKSGLPNGGSPTCVDGTTVNLNFIDLSWVSSNMAAIGTPLTTT